MEIGLEQVRLERSGPRNPGWVLECGGALRGTAEAGTPPPPATASPTCPQVQEVQPITSYDAAGSFLLLGCDNGSIYYVGEQQLGYRRAGEPSQESGRGGKSPGELNKPSLPSPPTPDVQKFPLRMKDNDLLVSELYRDPAEDGVTALSVYLTPKTSKLWPALHPAISPGPQLAPHHLCSLTQ